MKTVLMDTNVLVFSLVENCPENRVARQTVDGLLESEYGFGICPQVLHESYSVLTRQYGVPPGNVTDWMVALLAKPWIDTFEPGMPESRLALEMASKRNLKGAAFFDCCLAALVINFELDGICTDNENDFKKLSVPVFPMRRQVGI